jgi:hypothetical protein
MSEHGYPQRQGLYDPQNEHDACGFGFVADIKGRRSHDIVQKALTVLVNLEHRGAAGSEKNSGDGAGLLVQTPHAFLERAAGEHGIRLPPEFAMIGKTLLNLDEIGRTLAPRFDPNAALRRHAAEITEQQMARDLSIGSLFSAAVEAKNFVQHLPGRINRILDRLADNEFEVKVDAIDEAHLMEGLQKVANRITTGLVLAALIVGAALMMRVETSFRLFGYPGVAILLFLAAAIGGMWLVGTILVNDIRAKRRVRGQARY